MKKKETYLKQKADKKMIIRHYVLQGLIVLMFAIVLYDSFKHQTPFYYICFLLLGLFIGRIFSLTDRVKHASDSETFIITTSSVGLFITLFLLSLRFIWGRSILQYANILWATDALYLFFICIYWSKLKSMVKQMDEIIYGWLSKRRSISFRLNFHLSRFKPTRKVMFSQDQKKHCIVALLFLLAGCSNLPDNAEKTVSLVMPNTETTYLGKFVDKQMTGQAGKTGAILLADGLDAFVGRVVLAEKAEKSIDVQYYMFHQDTVGQLLIHRLIKAADRGVRVRLLIDDMYGEEADEVWTALDSHPHMEVRLFNPFVRGSSKTLQFITRLSDVNYRMHSKSFTVDNRVTIIGGRNIGDEYFDADKDLAFADLDMLAMGPAVPVVSDAFDQYWNSDHAYPASTLAGKALMEALPSLKKRLAEFENNTAARRYIAALYNSELANGLLHSGTIRLNWGEAHVTHDSSEKKEREENWREDLLISQLWPYMESLKEELLIISPYFVPGPRGADALCRLSEKGVRIRILTNSLASNDVSAVHAGYSRYRKQLLRAGIELYELDEEIKKDVLKRLSWLPGLSKSSLHAKTMVLDRKSMFVGSMNLDQRSLNINNEIGILFFNKEMADKSARTFIENIEKVAFRVTLDSSGSLQWKVNRNGKEIVFKDEPYAGFWTNLSVWLVSLLPVESFL